MTLKQRWESGEAAVKKIFIDEYYCTKAEIRKLKRQLERENPGTQAGVETDPLYPGAWYLFHYLID